MQTSMSIIRAAAACVLTSAIASAQAIQIARLEGNTADINDGYGRAVAMDVDIAVVGAQGDAYEEAVFVYRYNGFNWSQEAKLASPTSPTARFGFDVAISGNAIAVGAYGDASEAGRVYLYRFDGLSWNHEATLSPPANQLQALFGYCVSLSGDTLVCGAGGADFGPNNGGVYVFSYNAATGWVQQAELIGPHWTEHYFFGNSADVSGDDLVVGAIGTGIDPPPGRAYLYKRVGAVWQQDVILTASAPTPQDNFGASLAISGNLLAIGAPNRDVNTVASAGAVHIYARNGSWVEQQVLVANQQAPLDHFGLSVDIGPTAAVVGSESAETCSPSGNSGAAYLFLWDGTRWNLSGPFCGSTTSQSDFFGSDVALLGDRIIAGSHADLPKGAAYVFRIDADSDGDGLPDAWETSGIPLPGNLGTYALVGANPQHKDLFLELDQMDTPGLTFSAAALAKVVDSFANAPVANPDGNDGITLHIDAVEQIPTTSLAGLPVTWGEFDTIRVSSFGSQAERQDANAMTLLAARAKAYRYGVVGLQLGAPTENSSGFSESPGNDFVITLGGWNPIGGTRDQKAGTLIHELGHTLGLRHGGGDGINFKPNYYSSMNYMWQMPHSWNTPLTWALDYSRTALPTLQESALLEADGIGAVFPIPPFFVSVPYNSGTTNFARKFARMGLSYPVDWNGNGAGDIGAVSSDINRFSSAASPSLGETLTGHNDWTAIRYSFLGLLNNQQGWHGGGSSGQELDYSTYLEIAALPHPIVDVYGLGKVSSNGCEPVMTFEGVPSVASGLPFMLIATNIKKNAPGVLWYSLTPAQSAYQGGTIYVGGHVYESAVMTAGGATPCGGRYEFDMNVAIRSAPSPASLIGSEVFAQYVYLDQGFPVGSQAGMTNAVRFTIQP